MLSQIQSIYKFFVKYLDIVLFAMLAGFGSTVIGYSYGNIDHLEQIPLIFRALDPEYLQNDFFVNLASQIGPRYIYSHILAFIIRFLPITSVFLCLTLFSNTLIGVISAFFSMDIFGSSRLGAFISICSVAALNTFSLGSVSTVYRMQLVPSLLAMPFLLSSIWVAFKCSPLGVALLSGVASLIHPTLGIGFGAVGLVITVLGSSKGGKGLGIELKFRLPNQFLLGLFIFLFFLAVIAIPYLGMPLIDSTEFVETVAHFRHPHFLLASSFVARDIRHGIYFLLGTILGIYHFHRLKRLAQQTLIQLVGLYVLLVLLSICGVLFIEIFPTRLITVLQPFRLLLILKWSGLVLISTYAGDVMQGSEEGLVGLLSTISLLSPTAMLINQVLLFVQLKVKRWKREIRSYLFLGITFMLLMTYFIFFVRLDRSSSLLFLSLLAITLFITGISTRFLKNIVLVFLFIAIPLITQNSNQLPESIAVHIRQYELKTDIQIATGELHLITEFAKEHTSSQAIFLTPPNFGQFRLTAERAILVDFRTFPFQDQAMQLWKERLREIYDAPTTINYYNSSLVADENYRNITDYKLLEVISEYSFDYAILYHETQTQFPILFETDNYKIVQVSLTNG